ncbi:hypothetical protein BJ973_009097 [Actinoplanes tereljensis]|uniref:Uncharacterized protein n=1 Tax=Paractinoplanes tereljensis TaxID=571912 RepID=A0A919NGZ8_9ACTN|nr:hypothetical protein [Actinoplanes tereljensis]GIF17939.1 hypothetical protein Ate02nite_06690 [Actinoplanes tereljensis]
MLTETLIALGAAGGTALVEAAATDIWNTAKDRVARLFGRDTKQVTVLEARLEDTRAQLVAAPADQLEQLRERQTQVWTTRLQDLLEEQPEAAPALQELLDELARHPAMAGTATAVGTRSVAVGGNVDIRATQGSAAALTMGNVTLGVPPADPSKPGRQGD